MSRARVLVVEDEGDLRQPLAELLAGAGYEVDTAANGLDALRSARSAPPDVIVLDLMMPVMNGWEFLRARGADPRLAAIPVVVTSAALGAAPDASHFMGKPFDVDVLLRLLGRLVGAGARPAAVIGEATE